jgi:hypothetical protein
MPDAGVHRGRVDDDVGIHHPARIPDVLHLGEQANPVRAVHAAEQLGARAPVAVLAGDGAAE